MSDHFLVYCSLGYVRIVLIVIGWFFYDRISVFLPLYAVSTFLDGKPIRLQEQVIRSVQYKLTVERNSEVSSSLGPRLHGSSSLGDQAAWEQ